jgi:NADPH:quinone reductase-like Zn-dependent oxidoreductase
MEILKALPDDVRLGVGVVNQKLIEKAKLKKGQKALIHAGSGGVGTFAIQLAKHVGATVATTTSTANIDLVKRLGADICDRLQEGFVRRDPARLRCGSE